MNPAYIVNFLLETLPGSEPAAVDEIMNIVYDAGKKVRREAHGPKTGAAFEQEVNPRLEKYGIRFSSNEPMLLQNPGAPALTDIDGVVFKTPYSLSPESLAQLWVVMSHELVHADQIKRAEQTGSADKMVDAAKKRIAPGGVINMANYVQDPHETTAHARTLIDRMRAQQASKQDALKYLKRSGNASGRSQFPKAHKRFLKRAAGYAEQLPSR